MIKKGTRSVGVAHQHCGSTGDVRNCQVTVMLTYATEAGHTFYGRRVYLLPVGWADDPARRRDAGVPEQIAFATKPQLGIAILAGAVPRGLSFGWVAADADYGRDPALRAFLHEHTRPYVLAIPVTLPLAGPAGKLRQPAVAQAGDRLTSVLRTQRGGYNSVCATDQFSQRGAGGQVGQPVVGGCFGAFAPFEQQRHFGQDTATVAVFSDGGGLGREMTRSTGGRQRR